MATNSILDSDLDTEFMTDDEAPQDIPGEDDYDEPSPEFIDKRYRGPVARKYEKKIRKGLNTIFRQCVAHEATVPDAAAIIMHGPQFAEKWGDLANVDPRVRRGIDMLTDGTENPYLAAAAASLALFIQVYRNHEESMSPKAVVETVKTARRQAKERPAREFRIPFTKRTLQIRFHLHVPAVENFSNEPAALARYVFENQEILDQLETAGITHVAYNGSNQRSRTR